MQNIEEKIIKIIKENFSNGVRDDYIATNKILKIYLSNCDDENISREFISDVIRNNGIEQGGQYYFNSKNETENLLLVFDEILNQYSIAYYSEVLKKHADFFSRVNIFSADVLKKILSENDDRHFYFDEFCSANETTQLDRELLKIFEELKNPLSFEDLQKKFFYVPAEKILSLLSYKKKYLQTDKEKYFSVSKIKFDTEEIFEVKKKIFDDLAEKNFAVFDDYDLPSNFDLNFEIPEKNLRRLIYEKFLSDDFKIQGKKIFKKVGADKNFIKDAMQKFLIDKNEINFSELLIFSKKVCNDSPNSFFMALNYGNMFMVRVDENFFVKNSLINFEAEKIDEALNPFVQEKIIPLKAVTSFTGFPPVEGYSWNLFLLESFLRKYSKKFTYAAPSFNNANVGAIYPKSMNFKNYIDVQAAVIVQEKISLEKNSVENFLIEQSYRMIRRDKVAEKIIIQAQEISDS